MEVCECKSVIYASMECLKLVQIWEGLVTVPGITLQNNDISLEYN